MQPSTNTSDRRFRLDPTIPLWGVILLFIGMLGQAVLLWQGQRDQVAGLTAFKESTAEKLGELTKAVTAMDAQSRLKDTKDVVRDERIADHERRLTRIEAKMEARK